MTRTQEKTKRYATITTAPWSPGPTKIWVRLVPRATCTPLLHLLGWGRSPTPQRPRSTDSKTVTQCELETSVPIRRRLIRLIPTVGIMARFQSKTLARQRLTTTWLARRRTHRHRPQIIRRLTRQPIQVLALNVCSSNPLHGPRH